MSFDVEWDGQMCKNGSGVKEVERLYRLALERKLENEEEQQFKDEIKVSQNKYVRYKRITLSDQNEPRMLDMIGLTDEVLPLLVEYNPMITVEILMIILKNKNNETIEKYLRQITNINVTLQSLEGNSVDRVFSYLYFCLVVNRLVTQVELPSDFIPYYITRCRKTCEDLEVSCWLILFILLDNSGPCSTGPPSPACLCLPTRINQQSALRHKGHAD